MIQLRPRRVHTERDVHTAVDTNSPVRSTTKWALVDGDRQAVPPAPGAMAVVLAIGSPGPVLSNELVAAAPHGRADAQPAAVVSIMRAEQIFLNEATDILRPLGLTFARYQVLGMLRWTGPLTLGALGARL